MDKDYLDNIAGSPYIDETSLQFLMKKESLNEWNWPWKRKQNSTSVNNTSPVQSNDPNIIMKNDLLLIIKKTIDIIIKIVKADSARSRQFFHEPLPQSWSENIIKETDNPMDTSDDKENKYEDYVDGEFLYNFHSKYRKQRNFVIEVGKDSIPLQQKVKEIVVFWQNNQHTNNINVKVIDKQSGKITQATLFKFYDNQVMPQTDAGKQFNISNIIHQAQPLQTNPMEDVNTDKTIKNSIIGSTQLFLRALYATVIRKAMEFKPKLKGGISLTFDDKGTVVIYNKGVPIDSLTIDKVGEKINSASPDESKKWIDTLDHAGYFNRFPHMKPTSLTDYSQFNEAVLALIKLSINKHEAEILATHAWNKLRLSGKNPNEITDSDIVTLALKKSKEETSSSGTINKPVVSSPTQSTTTQSTTPKPETNVDAVQEKEIEGKTYIIWYRPGKGPLTLTSVQAGAALLNKNNYGFIQAMKDQGLADKYIEIYKQVVGTIEEKEIEGKTYVIWYRPGGKEPLTLTSAQAGSALLNKNNWRFIQAMKDQHLADKYLEIYKQVHAANKNSKKKKSKITELINPFQKSNFLY